MRLFVGLRAVNRHIYAAVVGMALVLVLSACGGDSQIADGPSSDSGSADTGNADSTGQDQAPTNDAPSSGLRGGVVMVGDVTYSFVGELICIGRSDNVFVQGLGTSDGEFGDAWVGISGSTGEDFDGDGINDVSGEVTIEHGKTDEFGFGTVGAPELLATVVSFSALPAADNIAFTFEISGSTITGEGDIVDFNGVMAPRGEALPMSFNATCG